MKAVLINSWYGCKSTGNLVKEFHDYLVSEGNDVSVFFGHGNSVDDFQVYKVNTQFDFYSHVLLSRLSGYQGCFSTRNTKKLIKYIDSFDPDVVYLFNLHAYYLNEFMLLDYLKQKRVKVVYMLFDEYPYLGKCCFSQQCEKFMVECRDCPDIKGYPTSMFFDRSNFFYNKKKELLSDWKELTLAGVQFLSERAKLSAIAKDVKFSVLDMGVALNRTYYPRPTEKLREKLQIPAENKVVVTVGQNSDSRKGIDKFYEVAKLCLNDKITFVHIGFNGKDKTGIPADCIPISYVSNQDELAEYYSLADVYVMTSSGEAMSLTCMESLGCGCKLVGFDISGTPYSASEEFGTFVPYNDLQAFADAVRKTCKKSEESIRASREYALSRYEISDFVKNLEKIGSEN